MATTKKTDIHMDIGPDSFTMILSEGLDVVAPNAEDLMQLRACGCAEVCQHGVAAYVYETKD